jgi:uncharacterized Zn finger protein
MMDDVVQFCCPSCGSETFKSLREVKTYEDFVGAACANCGRVVTDDDIRGQARKIAEELVRDAFRKAGF